MACAALHSTLRMSLWKLDAGASQEQKLESRNRFLGFAYRSPFSGQVFMKNIQGGKNFLFVDLYTRDMIEGSINELGSDEYLFNAKPLCQRTWVWHDAYRTSQDNGTLSGLQNLGLNVALNLRLDEDSTDWSPILAYAPLQVVAAFSMDPLVLFTGIAVMAICVFIGLQMNHATQYHLDRFVSLPFRIVYAILTAYRLFASGALQDGNAVAVVGYLIVLGVIGFDCIAGDVVQFLGRRNGSRLEILRELGNQVFIVKWHGLPHKNPYYDLPDRIIGVPPGEQRSTNSRYMIVAVVQGILCELLPNDENMKVALENLITGRGTPDGQAVEKDWLMPFCGLDVFDSINSDLRRLSAVQKAHEASKQKAESRDTVQDLVAARSRLSPNSVLSAGWT
jgi:hypothetical protein